jgi:hypothetical protein
MSDHHDDELPALAPADLSQVTGGAGFDMMSMLPMILMMRGRAQSAAAPPAQPAPDPWKPKILVNGVEQAGTSTANGTTFNTEL